MLHIQNMLKEQTKHLSFHTPGHKRAGDDITELSYSDCLLSPSGVILEAEKDVAEILGAKRSFLLTDGSTSGVHSMLWALKLAGKKSIAVPEYSHRSVYTGCELAGLNIVKIPQKRVHGMPVQPGADEIQAAMKGADALLLTSPDYYGFFPPLESAREICKDKPLLIDGAHGAHLHGTDRHAGRFADLWVDGVHKSLPALTQGAVVSAKTEEWATNLRSGVRVFRTTSPSYPIMASVEAAVKYPRNERIERAAERCKAQLGAVDNPDWSKILIAFGEYADGAQEYLERRKVYPEFNDGNYLMFYLSPCTKERDLKKLARLLKDLPRGEVKKDAPSGAIPMYAEEL